MNFTLMIFYYLDRKSTILLYKFLPNFLFSLILYKTEERSLYSFYQSLINNKKLPIIDSFIQMSFEI